ncbi:MAG: calcium channel protein [Chaenotheca gracillima]|nr:MAG: calcium channel protein [Chaenotheca gracillima]
MGCCQSTERSEDDEDPRRYPPYIQSGTHGDSSSRAINANASGPTRASEGDSTRDAASERPPRQSNLGAHFNQPLRHHEWTSKKSWTRQQLDREREEFFDTQVSGRPESWNAVHMAIETMQTDLETAQTILDAAGITVPTGQYLSGIRDLINGVYDEFGNYYQIPEHCISDPTNLASSTSTDDEPTTGSKAASLKDAISDAEEEEIARRREEKGKGVVHAAEMYSVRARLSDRGGPDVIISLGKEQTIRVLTRRVQEEAGIVGRNKVKIAYMGKILKEGQTLPGQGWQKGHVVNALVFP